MSFTYFVDRSGTLVVDVPAEPPVDGIRESRPPLGDRWWTVAVSAVIPARNEAANIPWVIRRLPSFVAEVIVVDGSTDDETAVAALSCGPHVRVIRQAPAGKGAALTAGLAAAGGEVAVILDADGSMDPAEVPSLIAALLGGADVAKGSRTIAGAGSADLSWLRRRGNAVLTATANRLYRRRWSDLCYGYAALWTDLLPALDLERTAVRAPGAGLAGRALRRVRRGVDYGHGFEIEAILLARCARLGLRIAEVPSYEHPRRSGHSQLVTFRDGARVLTALLAESRYRAPAAPAVSRTYPIVPAIVTAGGGDRPHAHAV